MCLELILILIFAFEIQFNMVFRCGIHILLETFITLNDVTSCYVYFPHFHLLHLLYKYLEQFYQ